MTTPDGRDPGDDLVGFNWAFDKGLGISNEVVLPLAFTVEAMEYIRSASAAEENYIARSDGGEIRLFQFNRVDKWAEERLHAGAGDGDTNGLPLVESVVGKVGNFRCWYSYSPRHCSTSSTAPSSGRQCKRKTGTDETTLARCDVAKSIIFSS